MNLHVVVPFGIEKSGVHIATTRLLKEIKKFGINPTILIVGDGTSSDEIATIGFKGIEEISDYLVSNQEKYSVVYWAGLFEKQQEILLQLEISKTLTQDFGVRNFCFLERVGTDTPLWDDSLYLNLSLSFEKIICPNNCQADLVKQKTRTTSTNYVNVVPTGVDTSNIFVPVENQRRKQIRRASLGLPRDFLLLVNAGRFTKRKRLDLVLESWSDKVNGKIGLVLFGSGFGQNDSVENYIYEKQKSMSNIFVFDYFGQVKREDLYKTCDVGVFVSDQEGEPTALVEVMASGLPSVVSNIPGHRSVITQGQNGFIFERSNQTDFWDCINFLSNNVQKRKDMGNEARKFATSHRSLEVISKMFLDVTELS